MFNSSWMGAKLAGAALLCAVLGGASAQAATRVDVGVGLGFGGGGGYYRPAPVVTTYGCEGHYETRVQRVLVVPERRDRQWVQPVYEARYYNGVSQNVCVVQGGWRENYIPARYEDRSVQVWVPGCATTYYAPRYVAPSYGVDLSYRGRY